VQQTAAGASENPEVLALIGRQVRFPQQIGHPDDGVHGSTDFMADTCQELALGLAGHFRRFFGDDQRLFRLAAFDRFPSASGSFKAKRGLRLCKCAAGWFVDGLASGWRVRSRHGQCASKARPGGLVVVRVGNECENAGLLGSVTTFLLRLIEGLVRRLN
jgi:hypothetical protein